MKSLKDSSSKEIALHGSYYYQNFGDILMLDIMTKWIKEYNNEYKVFLPHASEEITQNIGADGYGTKSLLKADALVYGGGGYLGEPPSKKYLWGLRAALRHTPAGSIMKMQNKPYAIVGVGVGPISNPITRKSFTYLCKNANILAVRDEESRNYLLEYGLSEEKVLQTSDIVMQLKREDIGKEYFKQANTDLAQLKQPIKIGIHLGANPFAENTELLKEEIIQIAKRNKDIGLVLLRDGWGPHPQVLHDIKKALPEQSLVIPYNNHWYFSAVLGSLDLVITTKLHVGITATALGKVAISISAHGKTPRFYKQIGASERCIPLHLFKKGQVNELVQMCISDLSNLYHVPEDVIENSKRNKKLLYSFLDNI